MSLLAQKTLTSVQRHELDFRAQPLEPHSSGLAVRLVQTWQIANIHEPFNANTSDCGRCDGPYFRCINPYRKPSSAMCRKW